MLHSTAQHRTCKRISNKILFQSDANETETAAMRERNVRLGMCDIRDYGDDDDVDEKAGEVDVDDSIIAARNFVTAECV